MFANSFKDRMRYAPLNVALLLPATTNVLRPLTTAELTRTCSPNRTTTKPPSKKHPTKHQRQDQFLVKVELLHPELLHVSTHEEDQVQELNEARSDGCTPSTKAPEESTKFATPLMMGTSTIQQPHDHRQPDEDARLATMLMPF